VGMLASSIERRGLLNPIRVTLLDDGETYDVISGVHRILAHEAVGLVNIDAIVAGGDPVDLEMDEIEENLARQECTVLQRALLEHRLRELYVQKYPETQQGLAGARARHGLQTSHESFAGSQAKPGSSRRAVERRLQIAEALAREAATLLMNGPIADKMNELLALARKPLDTRTEIATPHGPPARIRSWSKTMRCMSSPSHPEP
jgi:hypothetical protein